LGTRLWSDVSRVHPLIEPILEAQGRNPAVTRAFLTLCERAFEYYPGERFVAQLPMILGISEGMPLGWRGTSLPARLAALIQRFSERTQPLPFGPARSLRTYEQLQNDFDGAVEDLSFGRVRRSSCPWSSSTAEVPRYSPSRVIVATYLTSSVTDHP
jgi:hypothetical protein